MEISGDANNADTTYTCEITSGDGGDPQLTTVHLDVFGKFNTGICTASPLWDYNIYIYWQILEINFMVAC